jgi:hypothetical protein
LCASTSHNPSSNSLQVSIHGLRIPMLHDRRV